MVSSSRRFRCPARSAHPRHRGRARPGATGSLLTIGAADAAPGGRRQPTAPTRLVVEDLAHPLDSDRRRASAGCRRTVDANEVQTSYKIEVRDADGDLVWDSEKVKSSQQSYVDYGGQPLEPGSAYDLAGPHLGQGQAAALRGRPGRPSSPRLSDADWAVRPGSGGHPATPFQCAQHRQRPRPGLGRGRDDCEAGHRLDRLCRRRWTSRRSPAPPLWCSGLPTAATATCGSCTPMTTRSRRTGWSPAFPDRRPPDDPARDRPGCRPTSSASGSRADLPDQHRRRRRRHLDRPVRRPARAPARSASARPAARSPSFDDVRVTSLDGSHRAVPGGLLGRP